MRSHLPLFLSTSGLMPFQDQKCSQTLGIFYIHQGLKPVFGALLHKPTFTCQQQRLNSFLPEGLAHIPARSLLFPITELQEPSFAAELETMPFGSRWCHLRLLHQAIPFAFCYCHHPCFARCSYLSTMLSLELRLLLAAKQLSPALRKRDF